MKKSLGPMLAVLWFLGPAPLAQATSLRAGPAGRGRSSGLVPRPSRILSSPALKSGPGLDPASLPRAPAESAAPLENPQPPALQPRGLGPAPASPGPLAGLMEVLGELSPGEGRRAPSATARHSTLTGFWDQALPRGPPAASEASAADLIARGPQAPREPRLQAGRRRLEDIKSIRVVTYNVLNLAEKVGKWVPDPSRRGFRRRATPMEPKDPKQTDGVAKALLDLDPDLVVIEEVENIAALENNLNAQRLGGRYRSLLIEGNDERGIDVGFMVKNDIPFQIEHRTHKGETWDDPVVGPGARLFSRDLPVLIVRAPGRAKPLFLLFGTHYKSKRTRDPSDRESEGLRRAQVERSAEIVRRLRDEFGPDIPLLFAGDFNGDLNRENTFEALTGKAAGQARLIDALDLVVPPLTPAERVTHTYHPNRSRVERRQLDAILLSDSLRKSFAQAEVYRYKDDQGNPKPIPRTRKERDLNPSDHFPVMVVLDFPSILNRPE